MNNEHDVITTEDGDIIDLNTGEMILESTEYPDLEAGKRHEVLPTTAVLMESGDRVLVNFIPECNPASYPITDIIKEDGSVAFPGSEGIARLKDLLFKAGVPTIKLERGKAVKLNAAKVEGSYVETQGANGQLYRNWSLFAFKAVTPAEEAG